MYDKFNDKNTLVYDCKTVGCNNSVYFTQEQEIKYRKLGFLDASGEVSRPKKCSKCRLERRKQFEIDKRKFYK
jgi:hypothetical protein